MTRGEVWWVDFDPARGGEVRKRRPAVIISTDAANKYLNRVQVVPMTSKIDRVYPSEAVVTVRRRRSKAMADQLTTVSKQRLTDRVGKLTPLDMRRVEVAVLTQLDLAEPDPNQGSSTPK